jgi:hypothetical protein
VVFLNWVYNYIRFDREGRLIIRPTKEKLYCFYSDEFDYNEGIILKNRVALMYLLKYLENNLELE